MKRTIKTLYEMREQAKKSFIENSIIVHQTQRDGPQPDTNSDLELIIELNQSISVLENYDIDKTHSRGPNFVAYWKGAVHVLAIKDLEERCRKANFAPYDDRLPVHDYEFEWDEHTIEIAENWLKQHHPELSRKEK